jgi:hypothetical protein
MMAETVLGGDLIKMTSSQAHMSVTAFPVLKKWVLLE